MDATQIVFANLQKDKEQILRIAECRFAHLQEAATVMLSSVGLSDETLPGALSVLGRDFIAAWDAEGPDLSQVPTFHREELGVVRETCLWCDAAIFADRVYGILAEKGFSCLSEESTGLSIPLTVAYVPHPDAHTAFQKLRERVPGVTSCFVDSFREAAVAVSSGAADACLLPVEGADGHRIFPFYRLLDLYAFRILGAWETPIEEGTIRFALLGNRGKYLPGEKSYISCRFLPSERFPLGAVLQAASFFGLSLLHLHTEPSSVYGATSYFVTFTCHAGRPYSFLTYLYLFSDSSYCHGVYS